MIYCANCGEEIEATPNLVAPYVHRRTGFGLCSNAGYHQRYATPDRKRMTIENLRELTVHEQPRAR